MSATNMSADVMLRSWKPHINGRLGMLVLVVAAVLATAALTACAETVSTDGGGGGKCDPNYSGCLLPNASDYDCAGGNGNGPYYTGAVQVLGYDEYGLDADGDGDGFGCE